MMNQDSNDPDESEPDEADTEVATDRHIGITGFHLPPRFTRSVLPDIDTYIARTLEPWQKQMQAQLQSLIPDISSITKDLVEPLNRSILEQLQRNLPDTEALTRSITVPLNEQIQKQLASITVNLPTFSVPSISLPALKGLALSPVTESMIRRITDQQSTMLDGLRASLKPLLDPELLRGINRSFLPPNLKEYADDIRATEVHSFLEQEGIPLYLVPRGRTAVRLLQAKDRPTRRQILSNCYGSLIQDCADVLEDARESVIGSAVEFALDGLGAMRAGHTRSAQAMFTATLDTLIYEFYPDRRDRGLITNRKKGADVPNAIDEMGVSEALVWLPIWNAHEEFWKDKGDQVPHYYSRHASVHSVTPRQYSKRNCIQVLMLLTSLIGYAERMAR
ncbi:hypothetical protein [Microbacterium sp. MPKO10]|uniref:hypothetical protein n=1 Tax=Microbacterium sp. MPKO10 TaxID=2989818 RepID=UPI00223583AF|nr:hypothetical protein [Microbacterium sp. MPKO10]MCW4459753.1 hypothetical protein [Microbacterium sp. MPKO10]